MIVEVFVRDVEFYVVVGYKNFGIVRFVKDYVFVKEIDVLRVFDFVFKWGVDMVFIGLEVFFEKGIVNVLEENGVLMVGFIREVVMFEINKVFVRWLMEEYKIFGRKFFKVFDDVLEMKFWIDDFGRLVVVKFFGFMGGKGVKVVGY